jgi:hypothetical protein
MASTTVTVNIVAYRDWSDGRKAVVHHVEGGTLVTLQLLFKSGRRAYVGDFPSPFDALLFANEYEWQGDLLPIRTAFESGMGVN